MPTAKKVASSSSQKKTASSAQGTFPLFDIEGSEKGFITLPKQITSAKANKSLLAQYVRVYLHNQRQGNASTKTRSEVIGSTKKIYKQKGTGKARHGDIKAPIFVGGGVVGGPRPKEYELKLNKKQKRQALFDSLSVVYKSNGLFGLDESFKKNSKTKNFAQFLKKMKLNGKKNLILVEKMERNGLIRSVRNVRNVSISDVRLVNPYIVLNNESILVTKEAFDVFEKQFIQK